LPAATRFVHTCGQSGIAIHRESAVLQSSDQQVRRVTGSEIGQLSHPALDEVEPLGVTDCGEAPIRWEGGDRQGEVRAVLAEEPF
jgi:hypothetical protein